jgi:hypothetical protein
MKNHLMELSLSAFWWVLCQYSQVLSWLVYTAATLSKPSTDKSLTMNDANK